MATQIIAFPAPIFETIYRHRGTTSTRLGAQDIDLQSHGSAAQGRALLLSGYQEMLGFGPCSLSQDRVLSLVLIPEGTVSICWPRPLPDEATHRLLEILETALLEIADLTAHECLAISALLTSARHLPSIGSRPVTALAARSTRQRRLRRQGLELARAFDAELKALDRGVACYKASLAKSDIDAVIASFSCHAEIGLRLRLRPGMSSGDLVADLLAESRRGGLHASMDAATALAETTVFALETFDPHALQYRQQITIDDVAQLNAYVVGGAFNRNRNTFWRSQVVSRADPDQQFTVAVTTPSNSVRKMLANWLGEMDPGYWVGIHALVHAAIAHLEFLRVHPFVNGNGRLARLLLQVMLRRAEWPALPWEMALEWLYDDYIQAVQQAMRQKSYDPLLQLMIEAGKLAVGLGEGMIEELVPVRDAMVSCLEQDLECTHLTAMSRSESLLRGVLVEGQPAGSGNGPSRLYLVALMRAGLIDRIRTPIGVTYNVPAVRRLLTHPHPERHASISGG